MWLVGYGASTAAGLTSENLWNHLRAGTTAPTPIHSTTVLKNRASEIPNYSAHWRKDLPLDLSHRERLSRLLDDAWTETQTHFCHALSGSEGPSFIDRIGVLLASTKGFAEDVVWNETSQDFDTLTPLLDDFLKRHSITAVDKTVVSGACASAAVALTVADQWLRMDRADHVIILSCDSVGEFVLRGFHSLQALTSQKYASPFADDRAGLQLGEAAAVLCISKKIKTGPRLTAAVNCEGVAATRPDDKGRSLYLALEQAIGQQTKPTLVIAHGTGTTLNDATEDLVLNALYGNEPPLVTGTKWCVGHTLGVSCAIDIIAAAKCLKHQAAFSIASTKTVARDFRARYMTNPTEWSGTSVLVSSLGFGGVHAGVVLSGEAL